MDKLNSSGSEQLCRELAQSFQGVLSWKWDERFQTVLAEFQVDKKDQVLDILKRRLDRMWDISNIEKAPAAVQTIAGSFGGIMPDQLLLSTDPDREDLVFCAWWPWGNGETVSIRLAIFYQKPSDSDSAGQILQLKEWFGIRN